ncbi:MAG: hypothetical protein J6Q65_05595 [Lentisphaeria bacterium]|nr:hypothetical protein [Lentisphaeria bacterium]
MTTDPLYPRLRTGAATQGVCSIYLENNDGEKLLAFTASKGRGAVTLSGAVSVRDARLSVTLLPDPPHADVAWSGTAAEK